MIDWLKKFNEIKDGWLNDLFPTEEIKVMAEERAKICAGCSLNINNTCSTQVEGIAVKDFDYQTSRGLEHRVKGQAYKGCGCPLSKKTKSPTSKCPIGLW